MADELNIFSTLEDVRQASDEIVRRDIGSLQRELVIEYIIELRAELRETRDNQPGPSAPPPISTFPPYVPPPIDTYPPYVPPPISTTPPNDPPGGPPIYSDSTPSAPPVYQAESDPEQLVQGRTFETLTPNQSQIKLKGWHQVYLTPNNANLPYTFVQVSRGVVAFKSRDGLYLSAQPNGQLEWNREHLNIWEQFHVTEERSGLYSFRSHHGKYLSAQPEGTFEVNRTIVKEWELFVVEEIVFQRGPFPYIPDSIWSWAHDGAKKNGTVHFLSSGSVKWNGGSPHGTWRLVGDRMLETTFNGVDHVLAYDPSMKIAQLITPIRNPRSIMWKKEFVFGKDIIVGETLIRLKGCHGFFLTPDRGGQPYKFEDGRPGLKQSVAFKSRDNLYLSAQPDGSLQWNREWNRIWEQFEVTEEDNGLYSFRSHHGKYLSAQPNGTFEVNRTACNTWELFSVEKTEFTRGSFPDIPESLWDWAHDGTTKNGTVKFLTHGRVKWNGGNTQGMWKLRKDGILHTTFNSVDHFLEYDPNLKVARLLEPARTPASIMWISEFTFGPSTLSDHTPMKLKGCHGYYLTPQNSGRSYKFIEVRPGLVAFKSRDNLYLSAQPNGRLEWNRQHLNVWEQFKVTKEGNGRYSFCSHHGKYLSAQPNRTFEVNRSSCKEWEMFTVES